MYHAGTSYTHGWGLDTAWNRVKSRRREMGERVFTNIGFCRWKKDRLFGFRSDPDGIVDLELPMFSEKLELSLNYMTANDGFIRVELPDIEGCSADDCAPLTGDSLSETVSWKGSTQIPVGGRKKIKARLHMEKARIFAYGTG
jgi:hypothetical protein